MQRGRGGEGAVHDLIFLMDTLELHSCAQMSLRQTWILILLKEKHQWQNAFLERWGFAAALIIEMTRKLKVPCGVFFSFFFFLTNQQNLFTFTLCIFEAWRSRLDTFPKANFFLIVLRRAFFGSTFSSLRASSSPASWERRYVSVRSQHKLFIGKIVWNQTQECVAHMHPCTSTAP